MMIYQPKEDSYLLQSQISKYAKGKDFLDMGSGSGIQSEAAKKAKARSILAADINPEAINLLKKKKIPAIKSDLFSKLKGKKFDLIVFNPPYLPKDKREDTESQLATTGGKRGDEIILRFLKQVKNHLKKDGVILIVLSSLTPKNKIMDLLGKLNFKHEILSREKLFIESLEVWGIKL